MNKFLAVILAVGFSASALAQTVADKPVAPVAGESDKPAKALTKKQVRKAHRKAKKQTKKAKKVTTKQTSHVAKSAAVPVAQ